MGSFLIRGGKALSGTVIVNGSKNSALPVLFATILTRGRSVIRNLPAIKDVAVSTEILLELGAKLSYEGNDLTVDTTSLSYKQPSDSLVCSLRASTYLIGAMLSRFGKARISSFGGCNFSKRPIDLHIKAAEAFGARLCGDVLSTKGLRGAIHNIEKASVGATVNSLLLAASAEGSSTLTGYATEPHIKDLISFLSSAGAQITECDGCLYVKGGELHGGEVTLRGDMIEAGTYLSAALVTGGTVRVCGANADELSSYLSRVAPACKIVGDNEIVADGLAALDCFAVTTAPYPGFPTDLQPLVSTVMAKHSGGKITEQVWQGRFGYLDSLKPFGINSRVSVNTAEIFPSKFSSANTAATDLRGGAACILAALGANGKSRIDSGELVLRGYESPILKLRSLGAEIEYLK